MSNDNHFVPCCAICMDEIPDDFEPIRSDIELGGESPVGLKESFIFLANLHNDANCMNEFKKGVNSWFTGIKTAIDHVDELKKIIYDAVGESYVDFFVSIIFGRIIQAKRGRKITDGIFSCIEAACDIANYFAGLLCDPEQRDAPSAITSQDALIASLSLSSTFGLGFNLEYRPLLGYCNEKFTFLNSFILSDAMSAVDMAVLMIIRDNIIIRRCSNCGDFFIPSSRSDEIYCDKVLSNGKTCKTIGYDEKVKRDSTLREYRKIYKTQNARKQRNGHRANIAEYFEQWTKYAKMKLKQCQAGEITLKQMIDDISTDAWMGGTLSNS